MKQLLTGLLTIAIAVVGSIAAPAAHADPTELHDMRGHFAAYARDISDPQIRPGALDITTQLGPLLVGRANVTGRRVTVAGTIFGDGTVILTGLDGVGVLTIHARIATQDPSEITPCVLVGRYQLTSLDGTVEGDLTAVHQVPATGAPSIGGNWEGVMIQDISERPVDATFAQTETGALTGRMTIGSIDDPDIRVRFALVGQAGVIDPGSMPGYSLIAAGEDGVLAILSVTIIDPGSISGPVRLLYLDGSVEDATIQLDQHQVTR